MRNLASFYLAATIGVAIGIIIAGCAPLDAILGVNPATGTSPAASAGQSLVSGGILPAPWGELGLSALLLVQNAYLAIRKYQARKTIVA